MDISKTLAMKLLEGKKIPYEAVHYPEVMRDAAQIAVEFGVAPAQVFKTLVILPPESSGPKAKPVLVMLPADRQLDLKKLAKALKTKKIKMATHAEAEALTGLQVGGISALALMNKGFAVYIDEAAKAQTAVFISAGQRGINLKVAVPDLVKVTRARYVEAT